MEHFSDNKLTRIGVFFDGNYFFHVSNYYCYHHPRKQRLSVTGIHDFVRHKVAQEEAANFRFCQVVSSHYFRGRSSANEALNRNSLYNERAFDHVLMNAGVVTHYLPFGPAGEKGIDVWLALEAFEQSIYKKFNVVVLIASDGDYVPLVRKLNALGVRVMVLGWDFEYEIEGEQRSTTTSQKLLDEATYPTMMHTIIDDKAKSRETHISNLFVPQKDLKKIDDDRGPLQQNEVKGSRSSGTIKALKQGYGFIKDDAGGADLYFHASDCEVDYDDLVEGLKVTFASGANDKGRHARSVGA